MVRVSFYLRSVEVEEKGADKRTAVAVYIFPLDEREKVVASEQVVVSVLTTVVLVYTVGTGRIFDEREWDAPLGESAIRVDKTGIGAVVPTWPGKPGTVDEMTGNEADFVFSEQRGHVVIVLVIKLVSTMMEVVPFWTWVVVTGQLVTVV